MRSVFCLLYARDAICPKDRGPIERGALLLSEASRMSQGDLSMYGARGLLDARERAGEYHKQLSQIVSPRLRRRLLDAIRDYDMSAWRLMQHD